MGAGRDGIKMTPGSSRPDADNRKEPYGGFKAGKGHFLLDFLNSHRRMLEAAALLLVMAIGLLVRLEDLRDWKAEPARALYNGEPLLTTFDGYYYLTLARDLVEGTYTHVDDKRAVPDYPERPEPPPLLSVVAAAAGKLTPFSMNWIGAVLPAIFGILLALPLYGLGRYYGGPVMGITAALMGLLSHYYVYRSSLGWFDTDCMNVTWATASAFFFLRFGVQPGRDRYVWLAAGLVVYGMFLWWWDQTPQVATVVSLLPLAVALIFFYRPEGREGMIFVSLALVLVTGLLAWKGFDLPVRIVKSIIAQFHYISKEASPDFPNIGVTISEQARPSFQEIVAKTTDSVFAFVLAGIGLLALFYRKPRESLFLSVPLLLACLSFIFAKRFLIFLAPVSALGIGFLVSEVWRANRIPYRAVVACLIVGFLAWPAYSKDMSKTFWPKEPPHLVDGMVAASIETPENAVIWAWWDHGYPMIYFSGRGTINDGAVHNPERSVYNGLPMATGNYRLAANFMRFYVRQGLSGIHEFYKAVNGDRARGFRLIKRIMASGPEGSPEIIRDAELLPVGNRKTVRDWLEFFFPDDARPVYLFLDWRLTVTSYWWFWLGSWDIEKHDGIHPVYKAFYRIMEKSENLYANNAITVDFNKGVIKVGDRLGMVRAMTVHDGRRLRRRAFREDGNYNFDLFVPAGFGAIEEDSIEKSVFNKLFLLHLNAGGYFRPVALRTPSFQLWEVHADRLVGSH